MRTLWSLRPLFAWAAGFIALIGFIAYMSDREVNQRCAALLTYARTTRDTLDAKIACEAMHDASNTAMAVGVAGGVAAGAVAGSASR